MDAMDRESEELAEQVHSVAVRVLRQLREAEGETRLSVLRLSILSALVDLGPSSVGRLAAAEQVPAPTMSRQVTALERAGYVIRRVPPASEEAGRERVKVTPEGVRALAEARTRRVQRLAELLDAVDPEERAAVARAAEILDAALSQPAG